MICISARGAGECGPFVPFISTAKEVNQLGRRNLTPQEASYYRGKLYESRKLSRGEKRDPMGHFAPSGNTANKIGEQYGVSGDTVKRDADFSEAVDKVAAEIGEEAKSVIPFFECNTQPLCNIKSFGL